MLQNREINVLGNKKVKKWPKPLRNKLKKVVDDQKKSEYICPPFGPGGVETHIKPKIHIK